MNPTTQQPTYELLKDLPYLKAGTIYAKKSFWHFSGDNVTYYPDKTGMKHERFGIHADYIEDNPDWFRRVEVKDWEVVDCLEFNGKAIHPYHEGICLGKYKGVKPCTIHSVRRLSDGETFTVGEDCGYLSISLRSEKPNTTAVIEKFEIKENDIWAYGKNGFFIASLNKLVKLPSPPVEQETIKDNGKSQIVSQLGMYNIGYKDAIKFMDAIILEAERKAFEAARGKVGRSNSDKFSEVTIEDKYPAFSDYIQSLKK